MDWATFERLVPEFKTVGMVYLQGWGEPLLHPQFWDMVRQVKATGSRTGFTTSGESLDEGNLSALLESGTDIMAVSLTGATRETHERFRPAATFSRIDHALVTLREMRESARSPLRLHLAFLLLRSNIGELNELVELGERWSASEITVSNLTWRIDGDMAPESIPAQPGLWPAAATALRRAHEEATAAGIGFHYTLPRGEGLSATCPENVLQACYISSEGDVLPCVFSSPALLHCSEERRAPLCFGNVKEASLAEIWNCSEAKLFREVFRRRWERNVCSRRSLPEPCVPCARLKEDEGAA